MDSKYPILTLREKQILELLAVGHSQTEVADKIFISPHTINFHVRNILYKLNVNNTTAAVAFALTLHLIQINIQAQERYTR